MTPESRPVPTIARVFDEGATAYAEFWAPALHRHALTLLAAVPPSADPRTVVDVAAGAGTLLPALRAVAGEGGRLVALDYSAGMLALADPTVPRVQADAAALPLASEVADVAVYAFVLFMLPDARGAVAEAARVTRPGGHLLVATWGTQLDTAADSVVREEIDDAGAAPFPSLARSDELTDTPDRVRSLLEPAGFVDVTTTTQLLEAVFDAASALEMGTSFGTMGWRYRRLSPDLQRQVTERAADRLAVLAPDDFVDRSEVLLTAARRRPSG
jgi:ubiquinone/menaquinone biosynthesis C-methylase UbiE